MKYTGKITMCAVALVGVLLLLIGYVCSCSRFQQQPVRKQQGKIKVVVVAAGHGFKKEPFFAMFDSFGDIEYTSVHLQDHSEIFEDVSKWDYDVMVLFNMTQEISPKRRQNFIRLLERGVGVVALHHSIGAFQQWPEYRKIIGGKYYLNDLVEDGIERKASKYKHDLNFTIQVKDREHPITRGMNDFIIFDETYKNQVFEQDNHVLLTTDHPTSDKLLCWVRRYGRAKVCFIQMGHGPSTYANANYRRLVSRAIRWCAGRRNEN
jgi:type 1 glutamine amidotransferase